MILKEREILNLQADFILQALDVTLIIIIVGLLFFR